VTHTFRLTHKGARTLAADLCAEAPDGTIVTFRAASRSLEQNAKLHAMLADVSHQVVWYGTKLCVEDWKRIFAASLQKVRVVPGIDAGTFVPVGLRTRDMTISEMSDMIELIYAFGSERGVEWTDEANKLAVLEAMRR
jgi:hypothetical protein